MRRRVLDPVTIHIDGSTAGFRLAAYGRSLARPRTFAPIVMVALMPLGIGEAVGIFAADDGMRVTNLLIGLGAAGVLVALGAVVALVRGARPSAITFDAEGVREVASGRTVEHGWGWVLEAVEDAERVTLVCRRPMRSFQLASSGDQRLIVLARSDPRTLQLLPLLQKHVAGGVRRG